MHIIEKGREGGGRARYGFIRKHWSLQWTHHIQQNLMTSKLRTLLVSLVLDYCTCINVSKRAAAFLGARHLPDNNRSFIEATLSSVFYVSCSERRLTELSALLRVSMIHVCICSFIIYSIYHNTLIIYLNYILFLKICKIDVILYCIMKYLYFHVNIILNYHINVIKHLYQYITCYSYFTNMFL